jgi:Spy/CpxP family protein refolding chaperone
MKKSILTLVVALVSITMSAQRNGGNHNVINPEKFAEHRVEQIKKACSTTEEQNAQLKEFFLKQATEMKARMDSLRAEKEKQRPNREMMVERQKAERTALRGILTEEQMAAYDKMVKERPNHRPGGHRPGGGYRPGGFGGGNNADNE